MTGAPAGDEVLITEVMVLPAGTTPEHFDWDNLRNWALFVRWRGPRTDTGRGGYAVMHGSDRRQLSRAGNWSWNVEPFQQRQYRWATLAEAIDAARAAVDQVAVNGSTWAQWCAYRDERWPNGYDA